jgi:site-specific recombinase XerD
MNVFHLDDARRSGQTPARGRLIIPTLPKEASMKFSELSGDYQRHEAVYAGHSEHTIDQYGHAFKQFASFLVMTGKTDDLRHFDVDTVQAFASWLLEHGASRNTARHRLTALSSLAKWAMRRVRDAKGRPRLTANPTEGFEWPARTVPETRFLHREELRAFCELALPMHESIARELLLRTGLRVSELCRANWEDVVDDAGGRAVLSVTVKSRGRREVHVHKALSPELVALLQDWALHRTMPDPGEPLLVNRHGKRWTRLGLTDLVRRLAVKAGITRIVVRAHVLRHTYAVLTRKAGLDEHTRSRLLHHQSPQSFSRYEHLLPDELHAAEDRVTDAMRRYVERPDEPESPK